jgi:hypothetical protein
MKGYISMPTRGTKDQLITSIQHNMTVRHNGLSIYSHFTLSTNHLKYRCYSAIPLKQYKLFLVYSFTK